MTRLLATLPLLAVAYIPPPTPGPDFAACEALRVMLPDGHALTCHRSALDGGPLTYAQRHNIWYDDMPPPVTYGSMSYYAPGVFAQVVDPENVMSAIDYSHEELAAWDGYIALAECQHVGRTALIYAEHLGRSWRLLVADCAGHPWLDNGYWFLVSNGIVGEVDYQTAVEMGIVHGPRCCFRLEFED